MKHMNRCLSLLLVFALLLSTGVFAADGQTASDPVTVTKLSADEVHALTALKPIKNVELRDGVTYSDTDVVRVLVMLEDAPTAVRQSSASSADYSGKFGLSGKQLLDTHAALKRAMTKKSINYQVCFEYTTLLNALSLDVPYGDLESIAAMDGVQSIHLVNYYDVPDYTIEMDVSNQMTGVDLLHDYWGGSGTVIAILDTGLTVGHEAFAEYPGRLEDAALGTNAPSTSGVSAGKYVSKKIPFAYDYYCHDNDVADGDGHGTHVAGIAAGYAEDDEGAITFSGAAPDAQLLAMKIFDDVATSTSSDVYFKALEDAYLLGADVINMSIGSQNGFTYDYELEGEVFGNIYADLFDSGIICCIAAGNEGSQADYASNWAGPGYVTSDYTDYGVVGSPSTYTGNLSVASVENAAYPSYVMSVGGSFFSYIDSSPSANLFLNAFGGKSLSYLMVPGYGESSDYSGLTKPSGKWIAVVERGELSFQDKLYYAANAGASGLIVYNNQPGTISMAISNWTIIPAVSATQEAGAILADAANSQGIGTLTVNLDPIVVDSDVAGLMSDFSSWGCTPSLTLAPQIAGVGGNVNSVLAGTTDGYCLMSGTSMATPDVAGCMATLLNVLRDMYPTKSKTELATLARAAAASTGYVLGDADGYPYSPRKQGAGLINPLYAANAAIHTYIEDPIANLGDSETGSYSFTMKLVNNSDTAETYALDPYVLTDYIGGADTDGDGQLDYYNTLTSDFLNPDVTFVVGNKEVEEVTVPKGSSVTVTVSIELSDSDIEALLDVAPNGTFIEGYVFACNEAEDLECHSTFMGYLGSWEDAPIMEAIDWRDVMDDIMWLDTTEADDAGNTYAELGYTYLDCQEVNTDISLAYTLNYSDLMNQGTLTGGYAGDNMFFWENYNEKHIAITTSTEDDALDTLFMLPMNVRNARHMVMIISDANTGELYYVDDTEYLPKTYYDTDNQYWANPGEFMFDGCDYYGNPLPNNTVVNVDYYVNLPYGDDVLGNLAAAKGYEAFSTDAAAYDEWSFQCTIDSEAPALIESGISYQASSGRLSMQVKDNQYLAAYMLLDEDFNEIDSDGFSEDKAGHIHALSFEDITDTVYLVLYDYAGNASYYEIDPGNWPEPQLPFDDLVDGQYYIPAVVWGAENKIVSGTDYRIFSPDDVCTRAQVVTFLYRLAGKPDVSGLENPFEDVYSSEYYYKAILWAADKKIVYGTDSTHFSPEDTVTRAQFVTFLYRFAGKPEYDAEVNPFTDLEAGQYYIPAVLWGSQNKIVYGTETDEFSPNDFCTRAQVVTFIYRYAKNILKIVG